VWLIQDKKKQTVVNNDSGQIMEMLNSEFDEISQDSSCPDLFPKELQAEITELNDYVADSINTGVYKCGFAESQVCYHVWHFLLGNARNTLCYRCGTQLIPFLAWPPFCPWAQHGCCASLTNRG